VFDNERQAVSVVDYHCPAGQMPLHCARLPKCGAFGGLKTVMAAALLCHVKSMSVRVWFFHDLVVHELFELLLGEAMHQFARLMCRLEVLAVLAHFVDVYLHPC
jgi:hypothetical protein